MRRLLLAMLLAALILPPCAGAWTWPTDGGVLRPFLLGGDPYAGGQHRGVDIAAPTGAPVRSAASGEVTFAGAVAANGKSLTVATSGGYSVTLTHLGAISVKKGDAVAEGDIVGTVGPSGEPELDVPYVHLGFRVTSDPDGYV